MVFWFGRWEIASALLFSAIPSGKMRHSCKLRHEAIGELQEPTARRVLLRLANKLTDG
jgi:hypothetical protein